MSLQNLWFAAIAGLWTVFFVLEGFDFGVGMLTPVLGRDDADRRVLRGTIGPFWDGNEVWLLVAGGATFAAFPDWYATMFSAFYLPLFAVLVALILRAVSFEFRDRAGGARWRRTWDVLAAVSCLVAPLLIGVALGGLLGGLPIDADKEFTGGFADLVQPYALATGVTFALLSLLQGLGFLRVRLHGELLERATGLARRVGPAAVLVVAVHVVWTQVASGAGVLPGAAAWLALTAVVGAAWVAGHDAHQGWAFGLTSAAIGFSVVGLFAELFPSLMVSTTSAANDLTTADSSSHYTLTLITIIAAVMLPVVGVYTTWGYWVFRHRLGLGPPPLPARADVADGAGRAGSVQAEAAPDDDPAPPATE